MMRLIDANKLLADIKTLPIVSNWRSNWGEAFVPNLINEQPTVDAVPVVRCMDCKHHRELNEHERKYLQSDVLICTNAEFIDDGWNPVWPDDFCRYGEHKIEED